MLALAQALDNIENLRVQVKQKNGLSLPILLPAKPEKTVEPKIYEVMTLIGRLKTNKNFKHIQFTNNVQVSAEAKKTLEALNDLISSDDKFDNLTPAMLSKKLQTVLEMGPITVSPVKGIQYPFRLPLKPNQMVAPSEPTVVTHAQNIAAQSKPVVDKDTSTVTLTESKARLSEEPVTNKDKLITILETLTKENDEYVTSFTNTKKHNSSTIFGLAADTQAKLKNAKARQNWLSTELALLKSMSPEVANTRIEDFLKALKLWEKQNKKDSGVFGDLTGPRKVSNMLETAKHACKHDFLDKFKKTFPMDLKQDHKG